MICAVHVWNRVCVLLKNTATITTTDAATTTTTTKLIEWNSNEHNDWCCDCLKSKVFLIVEHSHNSIINNNSNNSNINWVNWLQLKNMMIDMLLFEVTNVLKNKTVWRQECFWLENTAVITTTTTTKTKPTTTTTTSTIEWIEDN